MGALPRIVVRAVAWTAVLLACTSLARAEGEETPGRWELSGFLGARGFSSRSALGAVEGSPASIASTVALGARLGYWLDPALPLPMMIEGELPLALSGARDTSEKLTVVVFEPRAHLRLGYAAPGRIQPFAVLGAGIPMAFSTKRYVVDGGILANLYAGGGVRIERPNGWNLRADLRAILVPARGASLATGEIEVSLSLYRALGAGGGRGRGATEPEVVDRDGDEVLDSVDECPDRAEDKDGFEDKDGCPDIDDDRDRVLDIADRCRRDPETRNGYRDLDGCPDVLPDELRNLVRNRNAMLFNRRSANLRPSARAELRRVARLLAAHESVRLLIIGHTDDREAPDTAQELSQQRAEAARDFLVGRGMAARRLEVWGSGADDPAELGEGPRARLRNRRVELRIWIPDVPTQVQAAPGWTPEESFQSP